MPDLKRELHLLVAIAKLDAELNAARTELGMLPAKVSAIDKSLADIEKAEIDATGHLQEMGKERRNLEQKLEDNAAQIKRYRVQLMEVKTNREYTAMLHEIDHLEKNIDAQEERLLMLMDELEQQNAQNEAFLEKTKDDKSGLLNGKKELEARIRILEETAGKLETEKPNLLSELDPPIKRRYSRVLEKLSDFAVTNIADDTCQGCFTRIPPQTAVEIRKNDKIVACEACGRILVHYDA